MNKVILSVLGYDRPGIVAAIANVLFDQNCNIENVSQTILQTEFAGLFIVTLPPNLPLDKLRIILNDKLARMEMQVHVKPLADKAPGTSAIIAAYGVNITNLQAVFKGGNEPGNNIMIYEVDMPAEIDQNAFCRDLRDKASALALDISIQHRNIFESINRI